MKNADPFVPLATVLLVGCFGVSDSTIRRETLPNGAILVSYGVLPEVPSDTLTTDLRIGKREGESWEIFGSIPSIQAAHDGTIYVLDSQALEVRAFRPDGSYLATLVRPGQGPGEIRAANGMLLGPEGTLWVQDHGARAILGISPEGREIIRHPMLVPGYGFEWKAAIDNAGTFRQVWSHAEEETVFPPEFGLQEARLREYVKSYEPVSRTYDSIFVGVDLNRYLVVDQGGGRYMSMAVPYDARRLSAIDQDGGVWTASSAAYDITRLDSSGDTSLVLQADVEGIPLTSEEREQVLSSFRAAGVDPILPEQKPVLAQLYADDLGRLWVEHTREVEEQPRRLDVYDREGQLLGAVQLPPDVTGTLIVRGQRLYAVARDELDVPYVVRVAVPAFARR